MRSAQTTTDLRPDTRPRLARAAHFGRTAAGRSPPGITCPFAPQTHDRSPPFCRPLIAWLAVLLIVWVLPSSLRAATYAVPGTNVTLTYTVSGSPSTATITDCNDDATGPLDLPPTLAGQPVTAIGASAFEECTGLSGVSIPNRVTSIGNSAFSGCIGLASVEIPDSVLTIGYYVFYECSNLVSVNIPQSVTSIGAGAFFSCPSLVSIAVAAGNPNYASQAGVLFNKSVQTLIQAPGALAGAYTIPNTVTSIDYSALKGCTRLSSVTIPDSVASIGAGAFYGCTGLASVSIPGSVTSIGNYVFLGCAGLASIEVAAGNLNYAGVAGILYNKARQTLIQAPAALAGDCIIPDTVATISDYAFDSCTALSSVTIPESVTSVGSSAFFGCTKLASVNIPVSVTSIGFQAFTHCNGLASIEVATGNLAYASQAGVLFDNTLQTLIQAPGALAGAYTIPDSVTSIASYAFRGCADLTSVNIPVSVTSMGSSVFYECSGLMNIEVAAGNPNYASGAGVLFNNTLQTLLLAPGALSGAYTIPGSVTSIGSYAFFGCADLTSVSIPPSVASIGSYAFDGCTSLTSVRIPQNVASIGSYAFGECPALTSATFEGHAPAMPTSPAFEPALGGFTIYYPYWATGFTSPTWQKFPAQAYDDGRILQTITFPQPPDRNFGEPPFTLTATASSGLPVSFVVHSGPATVAGATLTLTGAGIVTIRAAQPGDATYAPASAVERSFSVTLPLEADLAAAIDLPGAVGSSSGAALWTSQTTITHDGSDALRSGAISHSQSSVLTLEVAGPATLGFWWKVSSESGWDYLRFALDGVEQTTISGEVEWQQRTYTLAAGTHTLSWNYTKDSSDSRGSDAGWLDQVVIQSTLPPATYATWRATAFGADAANDAIAGPLADPDAAGVTNLHRYAFSLPARGPVANPGVLGTADNAAGRVLTLTFPRRAVATDLSYIVEGSSDLVTWSPVPDRTYGPGSGPVTAEDSVALGAASRRFLRVLVSSP